MGSDILGFRPLCDNTVCFDHWPPEDKEAKRLYINVGGRGTVIEADDARKLYAWLAVWFS